MQESEETIPEEAAATSTPPKNRLQREQAHR
jgi:hypothetical protein